MYDNLTKPQAIGLLIGKGLVIVALAVLIIKIWA